MPKDDDKECKFQTYRGTNLDYDLLCEPTCLDHKEKEGDNLSGGRLINLQILKTNIENVLVSQ